MSRTLIAADKIRVALVYFLRVAGGRVAGCLRVKRTPKLLLAGVQRRTAVSPELAVPAYSQGLPRLAGFTFGVNQKRLFREETIFLVKLQADPSVKIAFCERRGDQQPGERCEASRHEQW